MPKGTYIAIPEVSSERRPIIPIGFMGLEVLCSNKLRLIPGATLYHFGVLTSHMHMAWTNAVGRLEMRYQYSNKVVYNTFPWPTPTEEQKAQIEACTQAVLDARALYPDCSLADLYDPLTMPAELRKAAEQGNACAQFNLSICYANGTGVAKDTQEAAKWFRASAEQGYANAQCNLGLLYVKGNGVPVDMQEALKWLRKAAEQGFAVAQASLGVLYARGEGVVKDTQEAAKWLRKAAEQGYAPAQAELRKMQEEAWHRK